MRNLGTCATVALVLAISNPAFAQEPQAAAHATATDSSASEQGPIRRGSGLQVTVNEAGDQVSGSFTKGGYTIFFEAVRGEANQSSDPDAPPFALDIRILDRNRIPFMMRIGGAMPINAAWGNDDHDMAIDVDDRHRAFAMAPRAAAALRVYAEEHEQARWEIDQLIAKLESVTLADLYDFDESSVPSDSESRAPLTHTTTATYKHRATIYEKPAWDFSWELQHSALWERIWNSSGKLLSDMETCNHGACARASSMTFRCGNNFYNSYAKFFMLDHMCDYLGSPYGIHTCNSDTRQQYLSVKYAARKDWGVCWRDRNYYKYAPNCD